MNKYLKNKTEALGLLMSEISERCWCAGWETNNEYRLWRMIYDPKSSREYGQRIVLTKELISLY